MKTLYTLLFSICFFAVQQTKAQTTISGRVVDAASKGEEVRGVESASVPTSPVTLTGTGVAGHMKIISLDGDGDDNGAGTDDGAGTTLTPHHSHTTTPPTQPPPPHPSRTHHPIPSPTPHTRTHTHGPTHMKYKCMRTYTDTCTNTYSHTYMHT